MSAAVVVLIVLIVVAVLVIARSLILIAIALSRVDSALKTVISDVDKMPRKTEPVPGIVNAINKDLGDAANLLEGLLRKKGAA